MTGNTGKCDVRVIAKCWRCGALQPGTEAENERDHLRTAMRDIRTAMHLPLGDYSPGDVVVMILKKHKIDLDTLG